MQLFGFEIKRTDQEKEDEATKAIVPPSRDDGAIEVSDGNPLGGAHASYIDLDGGAKNEAELVTKYREMSLQPEIDIAIDEIVNESIVQEDNEPAVEIVLDETGLSKKLQDSIRKEFRNVMKILDFQNEGYDIFRRWYVDGRLYYNIVIDLKNPREGIKDLRLMDPRRIRKIRKTKTEEDKRTGAILHKGAEEFYIYNPRGMVGAKPETTGVKLPRDSVIHVTSGIMDARNRLVLSHLHKAIKPANQLRMLEDATVIYRISRAPERRIFYIDVGNLPKMKAEQYLRDMMVKHKNKLVYNAATGEVKDDRRFMSMLEDFWLPRREGGRGTEITTLPGGANLGEIEDVKYFLNKTYKSLNVPIGRLEPESTFVLGRSNEVTRDEVKFNKFIKRLRQRFTHLFDNAMEIQLALKGIVSRASWKKIKEDIYYDFKHDNHFTELKDAEILRERLGLLTEIDPYVGVYYSKAWVRENILKMTESEIELERKQMEKEREDDTEDLKDFNMVPSPVGGPPVPDPKKPNAIPGIPIPGMPGPEGTPATTTPPKTPAAPNPKNKVNTQPRREEAQLDLLDTIELLEDDHELMTEEEKKFTESLWQKMMNNETIRDKVIDPETF